MLNLIKKSVFINFLMLFALISVGFYFTLNKPSAQAADNNFALTWSSDSYIPPGYEGLALPTMRSQIKVFVLPTKKLSIDPEKLTYRWLLDEDIVSSSGGQGKSVFSFLVTKWPGDYHTIVSQVLDGSNIIWRGSVEIKISNAQAILKLSNDNYSIPEMFTTKTGQTLKILATPFFFNIKDPSSLNFQWELDRQELINTDNKDFNIFSLTIPAGKIKDALIKNLELLISDKKDSDQQASSQITLKIE